MLHPDRLDGVQQQPAARIFCKVTEPGFFVVKLVFADDPHPLCLVQFFTFGPSLVITVPVWVFIIVIRPPQAPNGVRLHTHPRQIPGLL